MLYKNNVLLKGMRLPLDSVGWLLTGQALRQGEGERERERRREKEKEKKERERESERKSSGGACSRRIQGWVVR